MVSTTLPKVQKKAIFLPVFFFHLRYNVLVCWFFCIMFILLGFLWMLLNFWVGRKERLFFVIFSNKPKGKFWKKWKTKELILHRPNSYHRLNDWCLLLSWADLWQISWICVGKIQPQLERIESGRGWEWLRWNPGLLAPIEHDKNHPPRLAGRHSDG